MSITVIRGAEQTSITDGTLTWLEGYAGLGRAPMHLITERGPEQHGETLIDFRLDPRVFTLILGFSPATASGLQTDKDTILDLFSPVGGGDLINLEWALANGNTRRIDCKPIGDCDMPSADKAGFYQKVAVVFHAPDPTFYDPTAQAETFLLGGGPASGFAVPTPVPTAIGANTIDQSTVMTNNGNWHSPPFIRITGPITDCKIENTTISKELFFDGVTIAAADYYDVNLTYLEKTIEDKAGADKLADLADGSHLGTFVMAAKPTAPGGNNNIRVTGSSVTTATKVEVTFYHRYLGI